MASPDDVARVLARADLRRRIVNCRACSLVTHGSRPVLFSGPTPAWLLLIGQAPGATEAREGRPFVGPAGQLLRHALRLLNLDPDQACFTNVVCCWPPGDRQPTSSEQHACRGWLDEVMRLADPAYVLLLGGVALSAFRRDVTISDVAGRWWWWPREHHGAHAGERLMFAAHHPAWALRSGRQDLFLQELQAWAQLVQHVEAGGGLLDRLDRRCVKCHAETSWVDARGLAWCHTHRVRCAAELVVEPSSEHLVDVDAIARGPAGEGSAQLSFLGS